MKYLREYNGFKPLGIPENEKSIPLDTREYWQNEIILRTSNQQFPIDKITEMVKSMHYHCYSYRGLSHFMFGNGVIFKRGNRSRPIVLLCYDEKVVIDRFWSEQYSSESARLRKMLREKGYNTRNCITYMHETDISKFLFDPLSPTFDDHREEKQLTFSTEFVSSEKSPVEEEENVTL